MRIKGIFLGMSIWIAAATGTGCLEQAAGKYSLNPFVLHAIVKTESGLNPYALEIIAPVVDRGINCSFGHSHDKVIYSCMPVRKLGLQPEFLLDPCYNLYVSAYILNLCWRRFGDSWKTIDCYNRGAGRALEISGYTIKVHKELKRWTVRER